MKFVRWTFILILVLFFGAISAAFIYLQSSRPVYHGEVYNKNLKNNVKIYFDNHGIPHIIAQNSKDAYFALGYVQAQERLFQMELLRRIGSGCLSEVFGEELLPVDQFFRTLGLKKSSKEAVTMFFSRPSEEWQQNTLDFIEGINAFMFQGPTPPEFIMMGIPKVKFTTEDIYLIAGYMSFSFAEALRTDPILDKISLKYGNNYINALNWGKPLPESTDTSTKSSTEIAQLISEVFNKLPVSPWLGSNGWAIAPDKSTSGKVLFGNDTHIGYQQPAVWYEAHIEYPGFSLYGNFLAGLPFPLVGHNRDITWGLTMFINDDMNLYREKSDGNFPGKYLYKGVWENFQTRNEVIKIKGKPDTLIYVRESVHGPVINDVVTALDSMETNPVALWWTYTRFPPTALRVTYELSHSKGIDDARKAASMVNAPGLNIVYGDVQGNIAIWSAAKLPVYPEGVNTKLILDGTTGEDDITGYYDFSHNPKIENPIEGFVYSANQDPDTLTDAVVPGYYAPQGRSAKIHQLLSAKEKWSIRDMESISLNVTSDYQKVNAEILFDLIKNGTFIDSSSVYKEASLLLKNWKGTHELNEIAPTIYYKFLANILEMAMKDELGEGDFKTLVNTHLIKNSYNSFLLNDSTPWWDDITTSDKKENRHQIAQQAFIATIEDLKLSSGDISIWTWGSIHTIEHVHPLGKVKPLDKIFNVGPFPISGGIETINNAAFSLNSKGMFKVTYGPAMRILIDMADIENGKSVLPTGQSGHVRSPYYLDQSILHINGKFRPMLMNVKEIETECTNILTLRPN